MSALLLLCAPSAWAGQVSVSVEAPELRAGQTVGLSVVVTDAEPRAVPQPDAPDGLKLAYRGQGQSQMMMNFKVTTTVKFEYALTALKEGDYTIPAISVPTSAGILQSTPLRLHVEPRGSNGGIGEMTATLDTQEAWVGQVLVYRAVFPTDQPHVSPRWSPPSVPGLTVEASVEPQTPEYQVTEDGKVVSTLELVYPLRATKPGKLEVPGAVLQVGVPVQRQRANPRRDRLGGLMDDLGMFSDLTTQVFSAPVLPLVVKALPTEGRPADFGGLVGHLTVETSPPPAEATVGETVTIEVTVRGDTPLAGLHLPPVTGAGFRVYDDEPTVTAGFEPGGSGRITAAAVFKRAAVPQEPGTLHLPAVRVPYFDPSTGSYTYAEAAAIDIPVKGAAAAAAVDSFAGTARREVGAEGEDILPVRTDGAVQAPLPGHWGALLTLPGGLWLGVQALGRLRPRLRARERRYDFADLPAGGEERLAGLDRIFRERVGAKLGLAPDLLHREHLSGLGGLAAEAEEIYGRLERLRYGGGGGALPEAELRQLVERL